MTDLTRVDLLLDELTRVRADRRELENRVWRLLAALSPEEGSAVADRVAAVVELLPLPETA